MTEQWEAIWRAGAAALGIAVSDAEAATLGRFLALLQAGNAVANLTSVTDPEEVAVKHFLDSLTCELVWLPKRGGRVLDLGTGAGFPGIPLALRHPETQFTLVDATAKKVTFLKQAVAALGLANVEPLWGCAEELGRRPGVRFTYHAVLARAVAHLAILGELALPLLRMGGVLVAMKGPANAGEIAEAASALKEMGGVVKEQRTLTLPDGSARLLVVVKKIQETPGRYPRDVGAMKQVLARRKGTGTG